MHVYVFSAKRENDWTEDMDNRITSAIDEGWERSMVKAGSPIVVVTGWRAGAGFTNTVRIIRVPDSQKTKPAHMAVLGAEASSGL